MSKKSAGWSAKDWNSKAKWQRSAVEDAGQSSQDKWKSAKPRAKWKDISHDVEEVEMLVKEQKSIWIKSCKESSKSETEVYTRKQKVWPKTRKLMTVQRQGRGKSGTRTLGRNAAKRGRGTGASVGIGGEFVQGARGIHVLMGARNSGGNTSVGVEGNSETNQSVG